MSNRSSIDNSRASTHVNPPNDLTALDMQTEQEWYSLLFQLCKDSKRSESSDDLDLRLAQRLREIPQDLAAALASCREDSKDQYPPGYEPGWDVPADFEKLAQEIWQLVSDHEGSGSSSNNAFSVGEDGALSAWSLQPRSNASK